MTEEWLACIRELRPVRRARWEEREGRVILHRPQPEPGGLRGVRDRLAHILSPPRVRLDALGAFAWRRLDGGTTVAAIAEAMRSELDEDDVEERLGRFLHALHASGLLDWEEVDACTERG